jgi:hypothetical protein
VVPGMGHDLPRELWPRFVEEIAATTRRVADPKMSPSTPRGP